MTKTSDSLKISPLDENTATVVDGMIIQQDIYSDTGIITKKNFNSYGQVEAVKISNEVHTIMKNRIILDQLPSTYYRVQIDGMTENINGTQADLTDNQFKVVYDSGMIYFNSSLEGQQITVNQYYGIGVEMIPTSRVYIGTDSDGNITNTLYDMIKVGTTSITALQEVGGALADGKATAQRIENDINTASNINNSLNSNITSSNTVNSTLENTITSANNTLSKLKPIQTSLDTSVSNAQTLSDNIDKNIGTLQTLYTNLTNDVSTVNTLRSDLTNEVSTVNNLRNDLSGDITNATSLNSTLNNTILTAQNINQSLTKDISNYQDLTKGALTSTSSPTLTGNWNMVDGTFFSFLGSEDPLVSVGTKNNIFTMQHGTDSNSNPILTYAPTSATDMSSPMDIKVPLNVSSGSSGNTIKLDNGSVKVNDARVLYTDSKNNV